nr:class I SAM-dependent methyltransferase [Bacteriovorax sp. HI3]
MLTERQAREKNYYEKFALTFDPTKHIDLSPVEGKEQRPWNSYWRTYELSKKHYQSIYHTPVTLLDFGCGPGDNALRFSKIGYQVTGLDICEENVKNCREIFSLYPTDERAHFVVCAAESLPFTDHSFDTIVGIDILHHVDIEAAMNEIHRVLKENGIAIFREPLDVPLLDRLRNTKLLKKLFPNTPSLDHHITEDERKLNSEDLKLIRKKFPDMKVERSLILSRLDKFIRQPGDKRASWLEKMDYFLSKLVPYWSYLGGAAVIIVKKKTMMSFIPLLPTLILHHYF